MCRFKLSSSLRPLFSLRQFVEQSVQVEGLNRLNGEIQVKFKVHAHVNGQVKVQVKEQVEL